MQTRGARSGIISIFGNALLLVRKMPLVRILMPYLAGVLAADLFSLGNAVPVFWNFLLPAILILFMLKIRRSTFSTRYYFGCILFCFYFLFGIFQIGLHDERNFPNHYICIPQSDYKICELVSNASRTKSGLKFKVRIIAEGNAGNWKSCNGFAMLFLKSEQQGKYMHGDKLLFHGSLKILHNDSSGFLQNLYRRRQIYATGFIKKVVRIQMEKRESGILSLASRMRAQIADRFVDQFRDEQLGAIATALVVGEEISISKELETAYSVTGTIHILCVSGMHVGLVFMLFSFLLKPMTGNKYLKHFSYPFLLVAIWCYSLLAGAEPSVLRASVMISLHIVSSWLNRKCSGIHVLTSSLFMMLLVNPFQLFEPGLQLSFFAVLGIICFHKRILSLFQPTALLLYRAWELLSVSIAAQVLTMPVSMHYFGQFPNYFLLSNLLIVPLTTIAIYGCLVQLILSYLINPFKWICMANAMIIKFSNSIVTEMSNWPYAITRWNPQITDVLLLYLLIVLFDYWLRERIFQSLLALLILLIAWTLLSLIQTV